MPVVAWPTDLPDVIEADLWLDDPSVINVSPFDGSTEVVSLPPIWHAMVSWGVLKSPRMHSLDAWLQSLMPGSGNCTPMPLYKYRERVGTAGGTITLFGAHIQGDTGLNIQGNTGVLERGDFIQLGLSTIPHVYQVVAAGINNIVIQPPLKRDYPDNGGVAYLLASKANYPLRTMMYMVPPLSPSPIVPGKYSRGRSVEFLQALRPDTL